MWIWPLYIQALKDEPTTPHFLEMRVLKRKSPPHTKQDVFVPWTRKYIFYPAQGLALAKIFFDTGQENIYFLLGQGNL